MFIKITVYFGTPLLILSISILKNYIAIPGIIGLWATGYLLNFCSRFL